MQFLLLNMLAMAALQAAGSHTRRESLQSNQCNTGVLQCCNSIQSASSPQVSTLLGLLGIVVGNTNTLVGLTCSPVSAGGQGCNAQPACCQNNSFGGLVAIDCTPVAI